MMTEYDVTWWGIGSAMLVVGIGIGMLVAYFLLPGTKRAKELQRDLEKVTAEFAQYRSRVTEHFSTTSDLFQDLTSRYRGLYDHLALGARDLCKEASNAPRLTFPDVGLLSDRKSGVDGSVDDGAPKSEEGKGDLGGANANMAWEGSDTDTKVQTAALSSAPDRK